MRNEKISSMLAGRIEAGDFPSAVYLVAERGDVVYSDALGNAVNHGEKREARPDTIYDLASLTKPLITGLLSAIFIERGELALDDPVSKYLPEFGVEEKRGIIIRHLLTHTSGLPAWRPLYLKAEDGAGVLRAIVGETLEQTPGTKVIYSDLGFITLGFLLGKISGTTLIELARREIFDPLKLTRTFFNPDKALMTEVAACEVGNAYERGTCGDALASAYVWREHLIWGEVHDGNAHFLGGAAGHAGLFSTAPDALRIANQFFAESTELLKPSTCSLFRTNLTEGMGEARSVGWQLAATEGSAAGPLLPPDSFGHLGFTGTSCWNDPQRRRTFLLFTNRTHTSKLPFTNINPVRREFHRLAVESLEQAAI